jgi:hypothetical protein
LFATDTLEVDSNCTFNYPSALGIINFAERKKQVTPFLHLGSNTTIWGTVFTADDKKNEHVRALLQLEKNTNICGELYSAGDLIMMRDIKVWGSVCARNCIYKSFSYSYYNYLYFIKISEISLSPYYLTSNLSPFKSLKRSVVSWLKTE